MAFRCYPSPALHFKVGVSAQSGEGTGPGLSSSTIRILGRKRGCTGFLGQSQVEHFLQLSPPHLLRTACLCPPPRSYVETLTPNGMVSGIGAFGR